ncbi:hypothetical protein GCM10009853_042940 [Glycomyces scopariae]
MGDAPIRIAGAFSPARAAVPRCCTTELLRCSGAAKLRYCGAAGLLDRRVVPAVEGRLLLLLLVLLLFWRWIGMQGAVLFAGDPVQWSASLMRIVPRERCLPW